MEDDDGDGHGAAAGRGEVRGWFPARVFAGAPPIGANSGGNSWAHLETWKYYHVFWRGDELEGGPGGRGSTVEGVSIWLQIARATRLTRHQTHPHPPAPPPTPAQMFSALPRFAFLRSPSPLHPSAPAASPTPRRCRRRRRAVALATISSRGPTQGAPPESSASAPVSSFSSLEVLGGASRALLSHPGGPVLRLRPYEPFPVIGWNRHVETIFAAFFRSVPDVRLRRECLRTADGGAVALDWVAGDERSLPSEAPVLILLVRLHLLPFRCQRKGRGKRGRKGYVEYTDM